MQEAKNLLHSCLNAGNKATVGSKTALQLCMNDTSFLMIGSYKADIRHKYIAFSFCIQSKSNIHHMSQQCTCTTSQSTTAKQSA